MLPQFPESMTATVRRHPVNCKHPAGEDQRDRRTWYRPSQPVNGSSGPRTWLCKHKSSEESCLPVSRHVTQISMVDDISKTCDHISEHERRLVCITR